MTTGRILKLVLEILDFDLTNFGALRVAVEKVLGTIDITAMDIKFSRGSVVATLTFKTSDIRDTVAQAQGYIATKITDECVPTISWGSVPSIVLVI